MKLKFENVGTPDEYRAKIKLKSKPESAAFYNEIKEMEVGQSFEVKGEYKVAENIRIAFRLRKWGATISSFKTEKKSDRGFTIFKIRAWRLS